MQRDKMSNRALLIGHFTTVGDVECLDIVRSWLDEGDISYDVAPFFEQVRRHLDGTVDLQSVEPAAYSHLPWPAVASRELS